jgi:hypothetical protein
MRCFYCDRRIERAWATFVRKDKRSWGKIWGLYCSKLCAQEDAVGPVFKHCAHRRISKKTMKERQC